MKTRRTLATATLILITAGCATREEPQYSEVVVTPTETAYDPSVPKTEVTTLGTTSSSLRVGGPGSTTMSASDQALVVNVQRALSSDPRLASAASVVQITASDGTVTLIGPVATPEQRTAIEALVSQTTGVASVNNQLQVPRSAAETPSLGTAGSGVIPGSSAEVGPPFLGNAAVRTNRVAISSSGISATSDNTNGTTRIFGGTSSSVGASNNVQNRISGIQPSAVATNGGAISSDTTFSSASSSVSRSGSEQGGSQPDESFSASSQAGLAGGATRAAGGTNTAAGAASTPGGSTSGASAGDVIVVHIQATTPEDAVIAQRISEHLQTEATLASVIPLVKVLVNDGAVVLQGNVSSEQNKNDMEAAVKRTTGIAAVDNQLQVIPQPSQSDR